MRDAIAMPALYHPSQNIVVLFGLILFIFVLRWEAKSVAKSNRALNAMKWKVVPVRCGEGSSLLQTVMHEIRLFIIKIWEEYNTRFNLNTNKS